MRNMVGLGLLSWVLSVWCTLAVAQANELSELRAEMQRLQQQMQAQQQKIEALEAQQTTPVSAQSGEFEEDLAFLQEQQDSLAERIQNGLDIHLYTTLEYESFERSTSTFDARNIELLIDVSLTNRLRGFAEIEFERTAKTSSGTRQGEVEVEQGWVEYTINDYLKPRAGVVLVPFGRYNLEHFDPFQDLTSRPIVARRIIPTTWAEAGVGFLGQAFLGDTLKHTWFKELNVDYQFFLMNGLTNRFSDQGLRNARGAFGKDTNNNKAFAGRLNISPFRDQHIAFSGYHGSYDKKGHKINGFDVDWKFRKGPFEIVGEYASFFLDAGGLLSDGETRAPNNLSGAYIQANYHFWFDFLNDTFLGRDFTNPTFTAVSRYGWASIADDGDSNTGANRERRWTIGVNYRPVETVAFKLEYLFNSSTNEALQFGDNDGFLASVSAAF